MRSLACSTSQGQTSHLEGASLVWVEGREDSPAPTLSCQGEEPATLTFQKVLEECHRSRPSSPSKETSLFLSPSSKPNRADWQGHSVRTLSRDTHPPPGLGGTTKEGPGPRRHLEILNTFNTSYFFFFKIRGSFPLCSGV